MRTMPRTAETIATKANISEKLTDTARWSLRLVRTPFAFLPGASIQRFEKNPNAASNAVIAAAHPGETLPRGGAVACSRVALQSSVALVAPSDLMIKVASGDIPEGSA